MIFVWFIIQKISHKTLPFVIFEHIFFKWKLMKCAQVNNFSIICLWLYATRNLWENQFNADLDDDNINGFHPCFESCVHNIVDR
jgi:hypothetical protein